MKTITFWKNSGHPALRGRTEELFKVSWDDDLGEWIRDEKGKFWGMYKLDTENVRRLTREPENMGVVKDVGDINPDVGKEVDSLEAEDISITPDAGILGEEE